MKKVLKRGVFKNFFSIIPFLFGMLSFNFNFKRQKKSKNWKFLLIKMIFQQKKFRTVNGEQTVMKEIILNSYELSGIFSNNYSL